MTLVTISASMMSREMAPRPSQKPSYPEVKGTTPETSGMLTKVSMTAVTMWMTRKTTASRDRFRCRFVTANRGSPGSRPCRLTRMPSTMTAVSRSRDTTPVARLAYQGAVLAVIPFISSTLAGLSPLKLEDSSAPAQNVGRAEQTRASGAAGRRIAGTRTRRRRRRSTAETRTRGTGVGRARGSGTGRAGTGAGRAAAGAGRAGAVGAGRRVRGTRRSRRGRGLRGRPGVRARQHQGDDPGRHDAGDADRGGGALNPAAPAGPCRGRPEDMLSLRGVHDRQSAVRLWGTSLH